MSIEKKNVVIRIAVLLVVVISCVLSGSMQLNRKVNKIEDVFLNGENNDQLSIHNDLVKLDDNLGYFLSLSQKYNVSDDSLTSLKECHKDFYELDTIEEYHDWYNKIKTHFPLALSVIKEQNLTDQHTSMLSKYEATYHSRIHTISYSPYNEMVSDYHKDTEGFIASVIKKVTGMKQVMRFD